MSHEDGFWKLAHLSDAELLEGLGSVLRTQRRALAELIAHLGEVEERRLHLRAAHGSIFAYCVALGMSEDEACRRIEVARLARKFPALFAELERGQITLSVALVLKPVLSPSNHLELLAAARGKCIRQARELVAERFPRPDAPSSIRKLPERQPMQAPEGGKTGSPAPSAADLSAPSPLGPALPMPALAALPVATPPVLVPVVTEPSERSVFTLSSPTVELQERSAAPHAAPPVSRSVIEPLSAQRYRIQFTADAVLKQQLEQARDLLRHAHPSGDFGPIVSRALKLLIDDLMRRRFGARARRTSASPAKARPAPTSSPASAPKANANPAPSEKAPNTPASERQSPACSSTPVTSTAPTSRSPIRRAARRAVLERDGLGCSWTDASGIRCGSQAWLELDHHQPAGKRGSSEPDNLRMLCRAHNGLAAEHAYGRDHIERSVRRRKMSRSPPT
ncbi:MAG: hypothetical protein ABI895_43380 [Deltaproteobacteria bacterium]